ncbi:MAG: Hsp33 family molecular chaperone HslO [Sphingopyxis sp.]
MSEGNGSAGGDETGFDQTLVFTLAVQDARGRIVRLGPVLETILAAHKYPPVAERLLAEALVLTALLGSTLKDQTSQLTLQAQTENGAVTLLVCDYLAGQLRGYLAFDADRLAEAGADPSLFALFGKGFLGITFDQGDTKQRYQGIVPLEGHCLADAAQTYFRQSEQLPTFARIAVSHERGRGCVAGGVLVQQMAAGEAGRARLDVRAELRDDERRWDHVRALAETIQPAELTDPALSPDALVWRLFHDEGEVRILRDAPLSRGCRCDSAYLASVIARFPAEDRVEMVGEGGKISVDCAFCSRVFAIDPADTSASH